MTPERFNALLHAYCAVALARDPTLDYRELMFDGRLPGGAAVQFCAPTNLLYYHSAILYTAKNVATLRRAIRQLETCEDRLIAEAVLIGA